MAQEAAEEKAEMVANIVGFISSPFEQFVDDMLEGTKSITEAFSDMFKLIATMLLKQGILTLLGAFIGMLFGGPAGAIAGLGITALGSAITGSEKGGLGHNGKIVRAAGGGIFKGGTKGTDSIHALVQEDEAILPVNLVKSLQSVLNIRPSSITSDRNTGSQNINISVGFNGPVDAATTSQWIITTVVPEMNKALKRGLVTLG